MTSTPIFPFIRRQSSHRLLGVIAASLFVLAGMMPGRAIGNFIWTGATNGNWSTSTNWTGGVPGGGQSVALFNASSSNTTITLPGTVTTVGDISFALNAPAYTINANGSYIQMGGSGAGAPGVWMDSSLVGTNITDTVNAPIEINTATSFFNWTAPSANDVLVLGSITNDATVATATNVALGGTGNSRITGSITDGATSLTSLQLFSLGGTWTLSGINTYSGITTLGTGTVVLDYSTAVGANEDRLGNGSNGVSFGTSYGSSTLQMNGSSLYAETQNETTLTLGTGANAIVINANGQTTALDFTTFTRQINKYAATNGTLDVTLNGAGAALEIGSGTGLANTGGILTAITSNDMTDWAVYSGGQIEDYTASGGVFNNGGSSTAWGTGVQTLVTGNLANLGNETTNSLLFNNSSGTTVGLNPAGSSLTLATGQIMVTSDVGANATAITGGALKTSSGELIVYQNDILAPLTISSAITGATTLTKSGVGTLILSGDDTYTGYTVINQGEIQLGTDLNLSSSTVDMSTGTVLDLNGYDLSIKGLEASGNYWPNATLAAEGLTPTITNSVAGTQATVTIGGPGDSNGSRNSVTFLPVSGAIIALNLTGGMNFGGYAQNSDSSWNTQPGEGLQAGYAFLNGPLTLMNGGGVMSLISTLEVTSAIDFVGANSYMGAASTSAPAGTAAVVDGLYLESAGGYLNWNARSGGLVISHTGSTADDGTALTDLGGSIIGQGTGILDIAAVNTSASGTYNNGGTVLSGGTGTINFAGLSGTNSYGVEVDGLGTLNVTGNGGLELGAGATYDMDLYGGVLNVAPSGTGSAVTVTGLTATSTTAAQMFLGGGATLVVNKGNETSLDLQLGNTANNFSTILRNGPGALVNGTGTLVIAPASGLANLGTGSGESIQLLSAAGKSPTLTNGIMAPYIVGQDTNGNGDFLVYSGTGATTDAGIEEVSAANDGPNYTTTLGTTATNIVELIGSGSTGSVTTATGAAYALRLDGTVTISGASSVLTLGASGSQAGLILNGGTITGDGTLKTAGNGELTVYTSEANGTIATNITGATNTAASLTKFGSGTLYLTYGAGESYTGLTTIDGGALDISGTTLSNSSAIDLVGGVLQGNGSFTRALYTGTSTTIASGDVAWGNSNLFSGGYAYGSPYAIGVSVMALGSSGGFSASGGEFDVSIGGTGSNATQLVWNTTNFVSGTGVLMFGSDTSDALLNFENSIDLGLATDSAYYDRIVNVTANSNDSFGAVPELPTTLGGSGSGTFKGDYTEMSGVISMSNPNPAFGFVKSGNGILQLSGINTYAGSTSITGGILLISSDANLGTAPTAAYPLVAVPDTTGTGLLNGHTLTPGALQIDGGTLAVDETFELNANRTILLGPTAGIDVTEGNTLTFNGQVSDYVNESGALTKVDKGTLSLGGANSYSGGTTVAAGTLKVNNTTGSATGTGAVNVLNGAYIGGGNKTGSTTNPGGATLGVYASDVQGIIAGPLTIDSGAHLDPGNSVGTLTAATLTLDAGSILDYEFNGTANDFTAVNGLLTIDGGGFNLFQEGTSTAFDGVGTYDLFSYGSLDGSLADLSVLNGQAGFSYTFIDDTSDDMVQLQIQSVPEPKIWGMMLGGFALLLVIQRKRSRIC